MTDSGSESDVPLRKKRKLDDASRASTPQLSTPKRILIFFYFLYLCTTVLKKQVSKRSSPALQLQVIPPPAHPTYQPIDLASVPPPVKPIIDRDYVAAENLNFETHSLEEIKRRLGVSTYPVTDLTKDLPGVPPTDDFSKVKAQNQVSHDTFIKTIEPYFRPFSEDDLTFLRQRVRVVLVLCTDTQGDTIAPYIIPPLGPDYLEVWAADSDLPYHGSPAPGPHPDTNNCMPRGSAEMLREEHLESLDMVSAGPLAERVLSALVEEKVTSEDKDMNEKEGDTANATETNGGGGQSWRVAVSKADYASFEERLKGELKYIGLLTMSEDSLAGDEGQINWNNREDDEICQELRKLQKELRQQSIENTARKMILEKKVEEQLAYQEYATILDDLDKQVGDAFNKRTKSIKAKKKRSIGGAGGGTSASGHGGVAGKTTEKPGIGDGTKAVIERRRRWIEKVGPVFRPLEKFIRVPTSQEGGSIYEDLDEYVKRAEEEAKLEEMRMVEDTS